MGNSARGRDAVASRRATPTHRHIHHTPYGAVHGPSLKVAAGHHTPRRVVPHRRLLWTNAGPGVCLWVERRRYSLPVIPRPAMAKLLSRKLRDDVFSEADRLAKRQ